MELEAKKYHGGLVLAAAGRQTWAEENWDV